MCVPQLFDLAIVRHDRTGTGKTMVIVESIYQLYMTQPSARVLVCASSNAIVDEICIRLMEFLRDYGSGDGAPSILRMYATGFKPTVTNPKLLCISNVKGTDTETAEQVAKSVLKYRVVLATLAASGRIAAAEIPPDHFTHLFIDECQSAGESLTLIPIAGIFFGTSQSKSWL